MKTTFDKATRDELIARINSLNENSAAQWGKMNVYQMVKHCVLWEEMIGGEKQYKQVFIGRIFGKIAMKAVLKNDSPLGRNSPTIPELLITGNGDIADGKTKWVELLNAHEFFSKDNFVHSFFGKMTKEQIGILAYKHTDHHLRQFNS
jgi:hypothetical protein